MMPREIWFQLEKNKRLNGWAFVLMMLMVALKKELEESLVSFIVKKELITPFNG